MLTTQLLPAAELSCPTFEQRRLSSKLIKRFHERRVVSSSFVSLLSPYQPPSPVSLVRASSCLSNNTSFQQFRRRRRRRL